MKTKSISEQHLALFKSFIPGETNFIPQTGIPKSKKLSTVMEMQLNILDSMPIALLSRIQELFLLTRKKFLFMLKIIEPTSKNNQLFIFLLTFYYFYKVKNSVQFPYLLAKFPRLGTIMKAHILSN